ncbi:transporter substrate-binding domain-containing protein [Ammoniphilus sp. YIM 78166]|uniref:transporter substrate-binding domain-containing protein n=1 Tax=Ammoniphilus sp. YIM 78166 TaxID=1644106 RepID=UPI00106F7A81|nr:transporter substrate-binding domain-containing protein [Ammoniphilus sp. YIM 78166]
MKKWVLLLCLFFLMMSETGATLEGNSLKVGYDPNLPPFSFTKEGIPDGYSVELIRKMAQASGWLLNFIPLPADEFVSQLESGRVDVVIGMKYRGSYEPVLSFSDSIFTMSEALIVPKANDAIYDLTDLKGKVVAVQRGTATVDMLDNVRKVKLNAATTQPHALHLLMQDRAEAFIGNRWTAQTVLEHMGVADQYDIRISFIQPAEYSFAVKAGNKELLDQINEQIQQFKRSGEYATIYRKWFDPFDSQTLWWQRMAWLLGGGLLSALLAAFLSFFWNKRLKQEVDKRTNELSHSLAFQQEVLERIDNGIISCDSEKRITLMNRRAHEILGVNEDRSGWQEIWEKLDHTKPGQGESGEVTWMQSSGSQYIYYYIAALPSGGWIISLQDRTEQLQLQEKLRVQEKLRALGQLVAGIAHELRNPLTSMKMFLDVLPKKVDDPRYREELLRHVPAEMNRVNNLVEDLLDYTRRKEPVKEWIEWEDLLYSIVRSFEIRFAQEHIQFELALEGSPRVYGDRQRVRQVLINLIANAVDAVTDAAEKRIRIETREDDKMCYLELTDTGKGMTKREMENLFQPFYTTKGNGVGLGLYISYNILLEHGGEITVESQEHAGTKMLLSFPKGENTL